MPTAWAAIPGRAALERPHRDREAVALVADAVRGRDADAVERQLGRRAAADAHLVLDARHREAVGRDLDDEARQPLVSVAPPGRSRAKTVIRSATEPWLMNRFEPSMT